MSIRPAIARFTAIPWMTTLGLLTSPAPARAEVNNPDISVIGQPYASWTDDRGRDGNSDRKRVRLNPGETEFMFDANLNPYARGTVIASFAEDEVGVEEAYFTLSRGLPGGLALRGGKYRAGFGKVNPQHPHMLPFAERFHVLSSYLPGEEAFVETGLSVSERIPLPGEYSLVASVDWLQGDSFRAEEAVARGESRPAVLGRLSGFTMVGERSGLEFGLSATHGTRDAASDLRTTLLGADVKAKLWNSPNSHLVLQGEVLRLDRDEPAVVPESGRAGGFGAEQGAGAARDRSSINLRPVGGYIFADYNFNRRYDAGATFERFQQATGEKVWDASFGLFAGFALMEETTVFRLGWERYQPGRPSGAPDAPDAVNTLTLRVVFSMGPHKAHSF